MTVFTDDTTFSLPANSVRARDEVFLNDQWLIVAESYNASIHGMEFADKWQIYTVHPGTEKVQDDWDREPVYPRDEMTDWVFDWDETVLVAPHEKPIFLSKNTGLPYRWFVNVYEIDRGYGGPEEGGWWFDTGEILRIVPVDSYEEAERVRDELRELFPHNHSSNSVIYSGGDYGVSIGKHPGKDYPETIPHYC